MATQPNTIPDLEFLTTEEIFRQRPLVKAACNEDSCNMKVSRYHRPADNGPGPDVQGCIDVGLGLMPAGPASKLLARALGFFAVATLIASPASVPWVNGNDLDPGQPALVFVERG